MALDNLDILHTLSDQMEYLKLPDPESLDQTEIIIRRAVAIIDFLPDFEDKNLVLRQLRFALGTQVEEVRRLANEDGEEKTRDEFLSLLQSVQVVIFKALKSHKYQMVKESEA